jgi:hypothetical protein
MIIATYWQRLLSKAETVSEDPLTITPSDLVDGFLKIYEFLHRHPSGSRKEAIISSGAYRMKLLPIEEKSHNVSARIVSPNEVESQFLNIYSAITQDQSMEGYTVRYGACSLKLSPIKEDIREYSLLINHLDVVIGEIPGNERG